MGRVGPSEGPGWTAPPGEEGRGRAELLGVQSAGRNSRDARLHDCPGSKATLCSGE